jgi:hypothetical protein
MDASHFRFGFKMKLKINVAAAKSINTSEIMIDDRRASSGPELKNLWLLAMNKLKRNSNKKRLFN